MLFIRRSRLDSVNPFSKVRYFVALALKAAGLLYVSKSWTALGLRIINRVYASNGEVPLSLQVIFSKSSAWFNLRLATDSGSAPRVIDATNRLTQHKNIFFRHTLIEFNIDSLLETVETVSDSAFRKLYVQKMNELSNGKLKPFFELEEAYFLKKVPNIKFFQDAENYLFFLPIKYLFRDPIFLHRKENYIHKFKLPDLISNKTFKHFEFELDGDTIWSLDRAKVFKGYQVITDENYVCYEKSALPTNRFIAGYMDAKPAFRVINGSDYVKLNLLNCSIENLDKIFLVSGRCTRNYFHWLIEYLPKLMWLRRLPQENFRGTEIGVDQNMPVQHFEALEFILKKLEVDLKVQKLNPDKTIYNVKSLLVCSNPTFIPDSVDEFSYPECSALNMETLAEFRSIFLSGLANKHEKKIYIARTNSANRKLVNEKKIIELCISFGFEVVYPEKLNFVEQLNLFNSAKFVIGPAGAAFSNLIFCQPGTTVINFVADENKESAIFANLCTLAGSNLYLATGKLLNRRENYTNKIAWLFSDFEISLSELETHLKKIL